MVTEIWVGQFSIVGGEASEQGLGKAEALAHGIYLALMTTAAG